MESVKDLLKVCQKLRACLVGAEKKIKPVMRRKYAARRFQTIRQYQDETIGAFHTRYLLEVQAYDTAGNQFIRSYILVIMMIPGLYKRGER